MCIPMKDKEEQKAPLSPDGGEPLLINRLVKPEAPEGYKIAYIDGIWQVVDDFGNPLTSPFSNFMHTVGFGTNAGGGGMDNSSGGTGGPGQGPGG